MTEEGGAEVSFDPNADDPEVVKIILQTLQNL